MPRLGARGHAGTRQKRARQQSGKMRGCKPMKHAAEPSLSLPRASTWTAELGVRMRKHLALKLVGTTVFTGLFFIGYFYLLRHPAYPTSVMPLVALDHLVPFQPQLLPIYLSLWFYVGIAPGLQLTFNQLLVYGLWVGALCLTGLTLFYFWPTEIPPLMPHTAGFDGFVVLRGVDAAGNACPSMHVAVAMFSALWIERLLRLVRAPAPLRLLNAAWFLAIAYSTLAIKQHVVLDVLAGSLLGIAFAWPSLHWHGLRLLGPVGAMRRHA
jgi:membrane-associated phospholipid phosphatase